MPSRPPDWQLPPSVTPGLWEYLHDESLAEQYLSKVTTSPFACADQRFVEEQLRVPGKVIDLGCGPGRSLLPLAMRGFECTGLDLSEPMLEQARRYLMDHQCQATWLKANLGEKLPVEDASFDAVLCLFGTLGMLHPDSARWHLLQEVRRILKPGGQFLLHVHNRWPLQGLASLYSKQSVMTLPVHQGISNLQMKLYTQREVCSLVTQAGWTVNRLEYVDAKDASGRYAGYRWLAPFRAAGFLLALSPHS